MINIPARHCMEYINVVIADYIVKDFQRICLTVKADKQIFVPCVFIIAFVQQAVIYGSIESFANISPCGAGSFKEGLNAR